MPTKHLAFGSGSELATPPGRRGKGRTESQGEGTLAFGRCQRKEGREEKKRKEGKSERTNGRHQFLGDYTARGGGRGRARKMKEVGRDRDGKYPNAPHCKPLGQ